MKIIELPGEQEFLDYVKQHKEIGYGRMMQIISFAWHEVDPMGALSPTGQCYGTLSKKERSNQEAVKRSDPVNYSKD
ncbi:hypothetical protein LCGC14_1706910 [marine sediment metagenome]|uniref:Uncharacterized protein n=1 Tax=marine sediment metagenome TaxID=412755 RepID=A0A0F9JWR2_9ZZZZ